MALTPTLLDHDRVDIRAVITRREGKQTDKASRGVIVRFGKAAKIRVGKLTINFKPSLAK